MARSSEPYLLYICTVHEIIDRIQSYTVESDTGIEVHPVIDLLGLQI